MSTRNDHSKWKLPFRMLSPSSSSASLKAATPPNLQPTPSGSSINSSTSTSSSGPTSSSKASRKPNQQQDISGQVRLLVESTFIHPFDSPSSSASKTPRPSNPRSPVAPIDSPYSGPTSGSLENPSEYAVQIDTSPQSFALVLKDKFLLARFKAFARDEGCIELATYYESLATLEQRLASAENDLLAHINQSPTRTLDKFIEASDAATVAAARRKPSLDVVMVPSELVRGYRLFHTNFISRDATHIISIPPEKAQLITSLVHEAHIPSNVFDPASDIVMAQLYQLFIRWIVITAQESNEPEEPPVDLAFRRTQRSNSTVGFFDMDASSLSSAPVAPPRRSYSKSIR